MDVDFWPFEGQLEAWIIKLSQQSRFAGIFTWISEKNYANTDVQETGLWSTENFAKDRAEYIKLSVIERTFF